ncbi:ribonuclease III [Candidatus Thiodictyon syntrophicum]|uniref:Ribonuclease 3 n=1 Tax=Candidatus Thiodictyon syntrophicum TaxID=1166950 RepID=A0A2K8UDM0_9GAMM|nr:ribonuclease III [Candidatus Thiodictyon syntrophicum]AUB83698.1 ribonuclease III [Candidatus Thiodictyon syntrophicum]
MSTDSRRLARALGHPFARADLLQQALTHRSAGAVNNERLEFLGDALIGFTIAEALVGRFPHADEGTLSRMRAALVKRESLAQLARGLELGDYLRLGAGELRTGGHTRDSILADALEAVLGAIYLDGEFNRARTVVLNLFRASLAQLNDAHASKDPKTRLQELLQARRRPIPEYEVLTVGGTQHAQSFTVSCVLPDDGRLSRGEGSSRRRAEQAAAEAMLIQFEGQVAHG